MLGNGFKAETRVKSEGRSPMVRGSAVEPCGHGWPLSSLLSLFSVMCQHLVQMRPAVRPASPCHVL